MIITIKVPSGYHHVSCTPAKHPDRMLEAEIHSLIGPAVRADFRQLYPANAKTSTCCPSDDNRTKVTNSVTSARFLWWHVGPYFWPADLTRTANPIQITVTVHCLPCNRFLYICAAIPPSYHIANAPGDSISKASLLCPSVRLSVCLSPSQNTCASWPVPSSIDIRHPAPW